MVQLLLFLFFTIVTENELYEKTISPDWEDGSLSLVIRINFICIVLMSDEVDSCGNKLNDFYNDDCKKYGKNNTADPEADMFLISNKFDACDERKNCNGYKYDNHCKVGNTVKLFNKLSHVMESSLPYRNLL